MKTDFPLDIGVIGGAGHVGLPLALMFADCGLRTVIVDIAADKIQQVRSGVMPFHEEGAEGMLRRVLDSGKLTAADHPAPLRDCRFLVCIIGTPVDEHLNPSFTGIQQMLDEDIRAGIVDSKFTLDRVINDRILKIAQQELRAEGKIK